MKGKTVISGIAFMMALSTYAQKDQIKALEKAMKNPNPSEVNTAIANAEGVMANATDAEKAHFYFLKGNACLDMANKNIDVSKNLTAASTAYQQMKTIEKTSGKNKYTLLAQSSTTDLSTKLVNSAIEDQNKGKFADGANKLHSVYELDKTKPLNLYYAASFAVSGKDYDKALEYYGELKRIDYSGEGNNYYAKSVLNDREESFGDNKTARDNAIKFKTHTNPRDEKIPSKRGEIYANIALILMEQGKVDEAKNAFAEARKANPDDVSLIISEANLYYNQGDFVTYKKIIEEAAAKNPTNPELFYNLGVAAIKTNDYKQAEAYYLKAIELNPKYGDAYYNIAILKIDADAKIVEEMNGLGNNAKDNARYNVLKGEREKLFKEAMPYLEKAVELNDSNEEAKKTLLNIYSMLDLTDKYKVLKAKM
jgi:tetratricopeptide (TPR) repeat protein